MIALTLALMAGAGGFAWFSKQREERWKDLNRAQDPIQGDFFEGLNEQGENVWSYKQDDDEEILIVEPPRFQESGDPNFEAWYRESAFFGRIPLSTFKKRLDLSWQDSYRGLLIFTPQNAILAVDIWPDQTDLSKYIPRHAPILISPPPSDEPGLVRAGDLGDFDVDLFEGFVSSIPAYTKEDLTGFKLPF